MRLPGPLPKLNVMGPETYYVSAVGCKVNQVEAQQLREALQFFGLAPAADNASADIALVNTCAVTRTAAKKSRQLVRRAGNDGRTPVIVVGCGVAAEAESYRSMPAVIAVLDHEQDWIARLQDILRAHSTPTLHNELSAPGANSSMPAPDRDHGRALDASENDRPSAPARGPEPTARKENASTQIQGSVSPQVKWDLTATVRGLAGHQRAFLKVQDGCDAGCTYCVIQSYRKTLRSKPIAVALAEAAEMVRAGAREIVLTGIFLGAYGRSTARRRRHDAGDQPLVELVGSLAKVAGLERVRLSSLEPGDVTDELLDVMADNPTIAPHLHLPLQAGHDDVLRRMNRQYRIDDYLDTIDRARRKLDRPAITTDVIVGFPGETDAHVAATLETIHNVGFARIHAFPFSLRAGTPAERWRDELLSPDAMHERMQRVQALAAETELAYRRQFLGEPERVIIESSRPAEPPQAMDAADACPMDAGCSGAPSSGSGCLRSGRHKTEPMVWQGRTDRYFPVEIAAPAEPDLRGQVVRVTITSVEPGRVTARMADA